MRVGSRVIEIPIERTPGEALEALMILMDRVLVGEKERNFIGNGENLQIKIIDPVEAQVEAQVTKTGRIIKKQMDGEAEAQVEVLEEEAQVAEIDTVVK